MHCTAGIYLFAFRFYTNRIYLHILCVINIHASRFLRICARRLARVAFHYNTPLTMHRNSRTYYLKNKKKMHFFSTPRFPFCTAPVFPSSLDSTGYPPISCRYVFVRGTQYFSYHFFPFIFIFSRTAAKTPVIIIPIYVYPVQRACMLTFNLPRARARARLYIRLLLQIFVLTKVLSSASYI